VSKILDEKTIKKMSIGELLAEFHRNVVELTAALNDGISAAKQCPSFGQTVKCDECGIEICIECSFGTGTQCLCSACHKIWELSQKIMPGGLPPGRLPPDFLRGMRN